MARYVFDCDAWLFAKKLCSENRSLLAAALEHEVCAPIALTEWVRKRELNDSAEYVKREMRAGRVVEYQIELRNPDYRRLTRSGVHRGEAEIIAWLLSVRRKDRPLYVVRDAGAARAAAAENLDCTDLMGLTIDMLKMGALLEDEAASMLSIWDDKSQQIGRPTDWDGFVTTLSRRLARDYPYGPP